MGIPSKWSAGFASHSGDFIVVIPKGCPLPARRYVTVTTAADSQADMLLSIYLGQCPRAADNFPLSNVKLECKEQGPAGTPRVRLTFCAYEHSIFRIYVKYKEGEPEQEIDIIPASDLCDADMARLREIVRKQMAEGNPRQIGGDELGVVALGPVK